jgi:hypothetical protein
MARQAHALESRYEGRLFTEEGRLYFIVEVNSDAGIARVSYSDDGEQKIMEMPISEVGLRLASSSPSLLPPEQTSRVVEQDDGWYFKTREGLDGPYATDAMADHALKQYIMAVPPTSPSTR